MIKTETYNNQTKQFEATTIREWIAPNGHKVTITTTKSLDTNTILSRLNRVHVTRYACECGKKNFINGKSAQKPELARHDDWMTDAEREEASARLMALLNA